MVFLLSRRFFAVIRARLSGGTLTIDRSSSVNTPLVVNGRGNVKIGRHCSLGYRMAPIVSNGSNLLQARNRDSSIAIGGNVEFSNNISIVALNSVTVGNFCLIANEVLIFDSDFHDLMPSERLDPKRRPHSDGQVGEVRIGNNVWLCARTVVLRDTSIGDGSVVAAGSVVSGSYPENSLISGVPATVVRKLA